MSGCLEAPVSTSAFRPGDRVEWRHCPRGGYGYVFRVPATVAKIGAKKILIAAKLERGGSRCVWVQPTNLSLVAVPEAGRGERA